MRIFEQAILEVSISSSVKKAFIGEENAHPDIH
jgi:hypothetical protein